MATFSPSQRVSIHNLGTTTYLFENGWTIPPNCCKTGRCIKNWLYVQVPIGARMDAEPHGDGRPHRLEILAEGETVQRSPEPAAKPVAEKTALGQETFIPAKPEVLTKETISLVVPPIQEVVKKNDGAAFLDGAALRTDADTQHRRMRKRKAKDVPAALDAAEQAQEASPVAPFSLSAEEAAIPADSWESEIRR